MRCKNSRWCFCFQFCQAAAGRMERDVLDNSSVRSIGGKSYNTGGT